MANNTYEECRFLICRTEKNKSRNPGDNLKIEGSTRFACGSLKFSPQYLKVPQALYKKKL